MKSPNTRNLIATFDKFLFSGLGCGVFGLCILMGGFVFVWQNPPKPKPTSTPIGLSQLTTVTPTAPTSATTPVPGALTATVFPTFTPIALVATIGNGTLPPALACRDCRSRLSNPRWTARADASTNRTGIVDHRPLPCSCVLIPTNPEGESRLENNHQIRI